MTISKKISLACAALVALTIVLGVVSILNIGRIDTVLQLVLTDALPGTASSARLDGLMTQHRVYVLRHMLEETPAQKSHTEAEMADVMSQFHNELGIYEKSIRTQADRELFAQIAAPYDRFRASWYRLAPLSRELKSREAFAIWTGEGLPGAIATNKVLQELVALNRRNGEAYVATATATGAAARLWTLAILLIATLTGALVAYFIIRGITKVLTQAVAELSEGAGQVSSASGEVAGSSQSLAQGASEQAASLEETSASSEEMASMTRKNSENSHTAAALMNSVTLRMAETNRTLSGMVVSMQEIDASSAKISTIIKVIDGIAFQTNILALNAAVEAARAGEAGMGFAVVADEVRNLAHRSAQAARETASLIEDSVLKTAEGSRKLEQVAVSIHAITEGAGQVKTLVDEVEASSKEQAQGIAQISKAIARMDALTQRTAANAEESAAASEQLNAQSQALMAVVGQLQTLVGGGSRP